MKQKGSGWHGESRRHSLARKGVKTVLPDGRRFDVSKFVANGELIYSDHFPITKDFEMPKTEKQFLFENIIREYIVELVEMDVKLHVEMIEDYDNRTPTPEEINKYRKKQFAELNNSFMRSYHNADDKVHFDAILYDIINYGSSDYGFGKDLAYKIDETLEKHGYYYELDTYSKLSIVDLRGET